MRAEPLGEIIVEELALVYLVFLVALMSLVYLYIFLLSENSSIGGFHINKSSGCDWWHPRKVSRGFDFYHCHPWKIVMG